MMIGSAGRSTQSTVSLQHKSTDALCLLRIVQETWAGDVVVVVKLK